MIFFQFFWKNLIIRNILFIAIVGFALLWGMMHWMDSYTRHNQALITPDLRGMSLDKAAEMLQASHLRFEVVDSVYSDDAPHGSVIDQTPHAHAKVKENRIVFLTVNAFSSKMIPLPDTEAFSQRQAVATLHGAGFKVDSVIYADYPFKDQVIGVQYNQRAVEAGNRLPFGAHVELLVGNGMETLQSLETDSIPLDSSYSDKEWFE